MKNQIHISTGQASCRMHEARHSLLPSIVFALLVACLLFPSQKAHAYQTQLTSSGWSGTATNAQVSVSCAASYTLVGCNCYSLWHACEGAFATGNSCTAQTVGGDAVRAEAICAPTATVGSNTTVWSNDPGGPGWSGTGDDAQTTATCPSGKELTGCSCFSWSGRCDGAKATNNTTCMAQNAIYGGGVLAQAICIPAGTANTRQESGLSATYDDAPVSTACPTGSNLTGCSCYSPWNSCDGSYAGSPFDNWNSCTAFNSSGGSGVRAEAICEWR
jgi:hypothetical protein